MSSDVFRTVVPWLSATDRLALARTDQQLYTVAARWDDVDQMLLDEGKILLSGSSGFSHRLEHQQKLADILSDMLKICPAARRMWIQCKLRTEDVTILKDRAAYLEKLYISAENFHTDVVLSWEKLSFTALKSLNIQLRCDRPLSTKQILTPQAIKALFHQRLRRICLSGVVLSQQCLDVICALPKLRSLDLAGSLVPTAVALEIIPKLGEMENLEELSLPSSMFAFTTKDNMEHTINFKDLRVNKLCLYMERFDEYNFLEFLSSKLPKNLKVLVLNGNNIRVRTNAKVNQFKKFEIISSTEQNKVRCAWGVEDCRLMTHYIWKPPYTGKEFRANTPESWRYVPVVEVERPPNNDAANFRLFGVRPTGRRRRRSPPPPPRELLEAMGVAHDARSPGVQGQGEAPMQIVEVNEEAPAAAPPHQGPVRARNVGTTRASTGAQAASAAPNTPNSGVQPVVSTATAATPALQPAVSANAVPITTTSNVRNPNVTASATDSAPSTNPAIRGTAAVVPTVIVEAPTPPSSAPTRRLGPPARSSDVPAGGSELPAGGPNPPPPAGSIPPPAGSYPPAYPAGRLAAGNTVQGAQTAATEQEHQEEQVLALADMVLNVMEQMINDAPEGTDELLAPEPEEPSPQVSSGREHSPPNHYASTSQQSVRSPATNPNTRSSNSQLSTARSSSPPHGPRPR